MHVFVHKRGWNAHQVARPCCVQECSIECVFEYMCIYIYGDMCFVLVHIHSWDWQVYQPLHLSLCTTATGRLYLCCQENVQQPKSIVTISSLQRLSNKRQQMHRRDRMPSLIVKYDRFSTKVLRRKTECKFPGRQTTSPSRVYLLKR